MNLLLPILLFESARIRTEPFGSVLRERSFDYAMNFVHSSAQDDIRGYICKLVDL